MPPRRAKSPPAKRQPRRSAKTAPSATPTWLWLLGGLCVGAVLAVAIFFQDVPRGASHRAGSGDNRDATAEKANKTSAPLSEKDYHLGDLFEVRKPSRAATAAPEPKPAALPSELSKAAATVPPAEKRASAPKAAAKTAVGARYWLQAGAFRSEAQADSLKARLTLSGLPVRVFRVRGADKKTWHRVRVGPYNDSASLATGKTRLHQQKIKPVVIKERS